MKLAGAVMVLLCCALCAADAVVKIKGVEFRDPVLSPTDDGKVKVTTVYGEKIVDYSDIDPIDIKAKNRLYSGYKLESMTNDRISLSHDGVTIRIKLEDLSGEYRPMFGLPAAEGEKTETPAAQAEVKEADNTPQESAPIEKSDFYLAGEKFREELIEAMANFTTPAAPAPQQGNRNNANSGVMRSVMFIVDEGKSAGSGFLCNLWGIPVVITNAHVFVTAEKPTMQDGMHNEYKALAVLVSPIRDLAIIKVDVPKSARLLELNYHVDELQNNAFLTAFGNSLGDGVSTQLNGNLVGIGPTQIEITAPIVGGNSGGPVVCNNLVIGVSTYGKLVRDDIWQQGSPFEAQYTRAGYRYEKKPVIRRFATRADNINPERLEVFDGTMQYKDLKLYRDLTKAFTVFLQEAVKSENPLAPEAIANRIYAPFGEFYKYKSHVGYINEMLEKVIEAQNLIFSRLEISLNYSTDAEKRAANNFFQKTVRFRKGYYDCVVCSGRGKKNTTSLGLNERSNTGDGICTECRGKGRYIGTYYDAPRGFNPGIIPVSKDSFGGIRLGWTRDMLKNSLKNDDSWFELNFAGAVTRISFERNPVTAMARESVVYLTMDKLTEVVLVFDYTASLVDELEKGFQKQFGEPAYKLENDSLVKILFKNDSQTVEILWTTGGKGVSVRWYQNVLFSYKQLIINDMGGNPYVTGKGRDFVVNNQRKAQDDGRSGLSTQPSRTSRNYNVR